MFNQGGRPSTAERREVDLYVYTTDVDDLYHRLEGRVGVVEGLRDTFYGMREFIIRDLNRFWVTFAEELVQKPGAVLPPALDADRLRSYAGTYRSAEGLEVSVTVEDGNVFAALAGQEPLSLMAVDNATFRAAAFDFVTATFKADGGTTTGVVIEQGPNTTHLERVEETR